ncbi:basic proline-rich protein-like [Prinia subflava]|uniref:basic proline-rich protein-like n=1 Tax=Prinia subflava TaxID=208062 RepID=UPI002FE001E5
MAINSGTNSEDISLHLGLQRMKKSRGKRAAVRKIAFKTPVFCGALKAKVLCVPKISDKPGPASPKFVKPTNKTFRGGRNLCNPPAVRGEGTPRRGIHPGGARPRAKALRQHPRVVPIPIPTAPGGSSPAPGTPSTGLVPGRPGSSARPPPAGRSRGPSPAPGTLPRSRECRQFRGTPAASPVPGPSVSFPVPGVPVRDPGQLPGAELPTPGICRRLPAPESPAVSRDRSASPIPGLSVG